MLPVRMVARRGAAGSCRLFIPVTYFDQDIVNWYLLLGMIAVQPSLALRNLDSKEGTACYRTS
jgi:hypothetical protein